MRLRNNVRIRLVMMSTVVMAVSAITWAVGQQVERVSIDADDIGGTVTSAKGPEAGVWVVGASYSTYATWHIEGGRGEGGPGVLPKAVKFQMRPNPLAK